MRKLQEVSSQLGARFQDYDRVLQPIRSEISETFGALAKEKNPEVLARFLMHFSACGYHMTRQVSDWIKRSGVKCGQQGHPELGVFLCKHASQEEGHENLHLEDLESIIEWNERRTGRASGKADEFLFRCARNPGVEDYISFHERNIDGPAPWRQLAVENEIELLSVTQGPLLIQHIVSILGFGILNSLSFVKEHSLLDVGHSYLNLKRIDAFLESNPEEVETMAQAGKEALEAYALHIESAFESAGREVRRMSFQ